MPSVYHQIIKLFFSLKKDNKKSLPVSTEINLFQEASRKEFITLNETTQVSRKLQFQFAVKNGESHWNWT